MPMKDINCNARKLHNDSFKSMTLRISFLMTFVALQITNFHPDKFHPWILPTRKIPPSIFKINPIKRQNNVCIMYIRETKI